jgi:hypothetical protein
MKFMLFLEEQRPPVEYHTILQLQSTYYHLRVTMMLPDTNHATNVSW